MSKNRMINTRFWMDSFIEKCDPTEKLLFIYLLTNNETNLLGIYEIAIRRIAFDTGIDKDMVLNIFKRFENAGKAMYIDDHVIIINFSKHQKYNKQMLVSAKNSFDNLPKSLVSNEKLIPTLMGIQRVSKGYIDPFVNINLNSNINMNENINEKLEEKLEEEREDSPPAKKYERSQALKNALETKSSDDWINLTEATNRLGKDQERMEAFAITLKVSLSKIRNELKDFHNYYKLILKKETVDFKDYEHHFYNSVKKKQR